MKLSTVREAWQSSRIRVSNTASIGRLKINRTFIGREWTPLEGTVHCDILLSLLRPEKEKLEMTLSVRRFPYNLQYRKKKYFVVISFFALTIQDNVNNRSYPFYSWREWWMHKKITVIYLYCQIWFIMRRTKHTNISVEITPPVIAEKVSFSGLCRPRVNFLLQYLDGMKELKTTPQKKE